MNKKAQGISINTIIIAAIAIIVLVVIIAIFTGRIGTFVTGVESCQSKGGSCKTYDTTAIPPETLSTACVDDAILTGTNCEKDYPNDNAKGICCIPLR